MTSFAIAVSLGHFYPEFQPLLLASALSVAISRVVLGMHFLTDIMVGALIGIALGILSIWMFAQGQAGPAAERDHLRN